MPLGVGAGPDYMYFLCKVLFAFHLKTMWLVSCPSLSETFNSLQP